MRQRLTRAAASLGALILVPVRLTGSALGKIGVQEALFVGGIALLGYGCSLVFWPAAFIVPGSILTAVAVFGVR